MVLDLEKLLKVLREYCKEDIIMINYYNPTPIDNEKIETFFTYANKRLKELCQKYEIEYVDIYPIFKENQSTYLPNPVDIHPSKEGYEAISKEIIKNIEKTLLKR